MYGKVTKAWQSKGFVPSVSFQDVRDLQADVRSSSLADIENMAVRKKSVAHNEGFDPNEKY